MLYKLFFTFSLLWLCLTASAQDSTEAPLLQGYLVAVDKKATSLTQKLDGKTVKYLRRFQQQEEKLLRKLAKKDSAKAAALLSDSKQKYQQLEQALKGEKRLQEYLPSLDTLTSSLKFLSQNRELLAKTKDVQQDLTHAFQKVEGLQSSLSKAETVDQFLKERKEQLTSQIQGLPFGKEVTKLHKQAYYYKAQVAEYKAALKDHKKLERKALELLSKTKAFQDFMRKHSQLASLFRIPGGEGESPVSLAGLQTRAQVAADLQQRFGSDPAAIAQLKEKVQAAQGELNALKSKAESLKSGRVGNSNGDMQQPSFRPNNQRTKPFLKRIELGSNVQTVKARWGFPVTSDLELSLGYRLNDKSTIGLGGSYKIGLGTGWQHISLSHQGLGLRSFVEYQLKGSFFIRGGYEQNYRPLLKETFFSSPFGGGREGAAWQQSGLIGLTKKYKVSKKLNGHMQLLWDFLSYGQRPATTPILFRIGYSLQ